MPVTGSEGAEHFAAAPRVGRMAISWIPHRYPKPGNATDPVGRVILTTEGRTTQELQLKVGHVIVGRTSDNDLPVEVAS